MTGTGTQTDPYIPENWEEFVEAITTSGAYISCPENAVWDMNEVMPTGITSTITIRAKQILGNNMTIKNLIFNCSSGAFSANSSFEFIKLNFLNMYATENSLYCFYSNCSSCYFRNCKFSGIIAQGSFLSGGTSINLTFTNDTGENPKGCSFNFEFYGNGQMCTTGSLTHFENCNIHISGKNNNNFLDSALKKCDLSSCYISGKSPSNAGLMVTCRNNIYNINVPNGIIDLGGNSNNSTKTVINDSIINATYSASNTLSDYLIKATEEQMHDAEYLKSRGFIVCG